MNKEFITVKGAGEAEGYTFRFKPFDALKPKQLLKDLEIGDIFYHAKDKKKIKTTFVVVGPCQFNSRHGFSTRICRDKEDVSKSCRLEVVKTGVSMLVQKLKEEAANK